MYPQPQTIALDACSDGKPALHCCSMLNSPARPHFARHTSIQRRAIMGGGMAFFERDKTKSPTLHTRNLSIFCDSNCPRFGFWLRRPKPFANVSAVAGFILAGSSHPRGCGLCYSNKLLPAESESKNCGLAVGILWTLRVAHKSVVNR
jgi:hypothetical protein